MSLQTVFFFFKTIFANMGLLPFHTNVRISLSIFANKAAKILRGTLLNLQINLVSIVKLTILSILIYDMNDCLENHKQFLKRLLEQ